MLLCELLSFSRLDERSVWKGLGVAARMRTFRNPPGICFAFLNVVWLSTGFVLHEVWLKVGDFTFHLGMKSTHQKEGGRSEDVSGVNVEEKGGAQDGGRLQPPSFVRK